MTNLLPIYTPYIKTHQQEFADPFWQSRPFMFSLTETCPWLRPFLAHIQIQVLW